MSQTGHKVVSVYSAGWPYADAARADDPTTIRMFGDSQLAHIARAGEYYVAGLKLVSGKGTHCLPGDGNSGAANDPLAFQVFGCDNMDCALA